MKSPHPNLAEKAKPTKHFKSQYGIIVIVEDEAQQQHFYNRLRQVLPGVKLKVVCV